jgi:hypothetical protein
MMRFYYSNSVDDNNINVSPYSQRDREKSQRIGQYLILQIVNGIKKKAIIKEEPCYS